MQYLKMALVGLIIGLIAQALYPGNQDTAWYVKVAIGIGGSVLAGTLGNLARKPANGATFGRAGFLYSVLGALVIIFASRQLGWL